MNTASVTLPGIFQILYGSEERNIKYRFIVEEKMNINSDSVFHIYVAYSYLQIYYSQPSGQNLDVYYDL